MTITERYKIQKGISNPTTLQKASSDGEDDTIDNYIISRVNIRQEQEQGKQEESIREMIQKTIEDTFNK